MGAKVYRIAGLIQRFDADGTRNAATFNAGTALDAKIEQDKEDRIDNAIAYLSSGGYDSPLAQALRDAGVTSGIDEAVMMPAIDIIIENMLEESIITP